LQADLKCWAFRVTTSDLQVRWDDVHANFFFNVQVLLMTPSLPISFVEKVSSSSYIKGENSNCH
jgi:hypothetical protein